MNTEGNLFEALPDHGAEELIQTLVQTPGVRIERIVSTSQHSPEGFWYDQKEDEFVLLLRGWAIVAFEEKQVRLKPGGWLMIPAHRRHRVVATAPDAPTVWLALFFKSSDG